jgi:multiple sugar transport system permease protein
MRIKRYLRRQLSLGNLLKWAVALVWFVFTVLPVWWMFNVVFSQGEQVSLSPHLYPTSLSAGVENIRLVLTGSPFLRNYLVSFAFAFVQITGMLLVCSMAAYEFALFWFPGKEPIFLAAISALMVPSIVTLIPTYRIVVKLGWLNSIQGLAVPGIASAFGLFLLRQFMENLPRELMDAAQIDGASHFGVYWYIALPLSSNGLITLSVLGFMFVWGSYLWPLVVATKSIWYPVSLAVASYLNYQSWVPINIVMAASLLGALPPIIVYVFLQHFIVEGVALTGLKA